MITQPFNTLDFPSIRSCKVTDTASSAAQPLIITHSIIVQSDFTWKVFVHNHEVKKCSALCSIPSQLDETSILKLISLVDRLHVCPGHPDSKLIWWSYCICRPLCPCTPEWGDFSENCSYFGM